MSENFKKDLKRYYKSKNLGIVDSKNRLSKIYHLTIIYGFYATLVYRFGRWIDSTFHYPLFFPIKYILLGVYICLAFSIRKLLGIHIDKRADIGKGFYIGHFGGITIGICRLGENCSINQHVSIGEDTLYNHCKGPCIGSNVWIGSHSKIKGNIRIEDNVTIAAGTEVNFDVASGALVMGSPSRIVQKKYDNKFLLY